MFCASLGFSNPDIWETQISRMNVMLNRQISNSSMSNFSSSESMDHPDRSSCIGFDCHMITQAVQVQNSHRFGRCFHKLTTVDFLEEIHPAQFASPNTSILVSSSVHGYLQAHTWILDCLKGYSCEGKRPPARGEAICRINSFTEYKRSGLSMARKLNRAATLWSSFISVRVRRSQF